MFRSIVFSLLVASVMSAAVAPAAVAPAAGESDAPNNAEVKVIVVDDISKLKNLRQAGAKLVPINRVQEKSQIRYTLGNRLSNDYLVSQSTDYFQWPVAQDVQLQLRYPASGTGAVVTFVDIVVDQSSNLGQAYVYSGGIGQRYIGIVVEAYNTYWFNYVAKIYGM